MEIKAIVISSPNYKYLLRGFYHLWHKYCDIPISKEIITSEPRDNWCKDVLEGIKDLDCTDILVALEDYYLQKPYDKEQFAYLINQKYDKIDLQGQVNYFEHYGEGGHVVASNSACYRRSLQMSIWKKEYLIQCLKDATNPWSFELTPKSNDNKKIIGLAHNTFFYSNIMLKGSMMNYELDHLNKEDRIVINDLLKK